MKKKNRKHSIIDGLQSDLRETVDEMIKTTRIMKSSSIFGKTALKFQ